MSNSTTSVEFSVQRQSVGRRFEDYRNEHLANLLMQLPDGILCLDREWRVTFANNEARRALHLTDADLNGRTHWELFPSKVGTDIERYYRNAMETGLPAQLEYYCPDYDIWLDTHVIPNDDGVAVSFRNVTDRKGAELLRDSASRQLNQVLEATTDAVLSINRDGVFTYLNRRAKELLAVKGDLVGQKAKEAFPEGTHQGQFLYYFRRAFHEGIPGEFEDYYPDPLNLWLAIQVRPSDDGMVVFFRDVTARRNAQQAILQQQDLLSKVQETALTSTWDIDLNTGIITPGAGAYPVFGRPHEEIPDLETFARFILPEYVPVLMDQIRRASETGELVTIDLPIRAADGSLRWIENRGQAVMDNGVPRLRGLSIDITQHKRQQEALAASEARYRILADLNPQAIWMASPSGSIIYTNQVLMDYLGFTEADYEGDNWLRAYHLDDQKRVLDAWQHSVATGEDFNLEARMIRGYDGRARWWWIRAQPVRDDQGNILHWLGVKIDIDDRKTFAEQLQQRQEATERQRAELESIYESAPVGFALFDPVDLRYLRVNEVQAQTIGLPKSEILGRRFDDLIPLPAAETLLRRAAAGETVRNQLIEGELRARPGEIRYWNVSYSPVRNSEGHVDAVAAVVQEITHQKKSEAALIQSEKLAAVGRLASSISHEINNPLESIMNLLFLINNSEDLPASLRDYVETAQAELSRVCQIATQTLRFHRQAVNATLVSAADLVDPVLNLYHGRLVNSNIRVETRYATSHPILCFENDIRQVLNNLIANAIDAMRHGGRLLVRAHDAIERGTNGKDREGIRLSIADTGHGMAPEVRSRIFEPFYTTKDLKGTGLGLWISAGIVDRHQGHLSVRSSTHPNHPGTIFSLFLPKEESRPR
jgi:PAS domain S-box-containing protein